MDLLSNTLTGSVDLMRHNSINAWRLKSKGLYQEFLGEWVEHVIKDYYFLTNHFLHIIPNLTGWFSFQPLYCYFKISLALFSHTIT